MDHGQGEGALIAQGLLAMRLHAARLLSLAVLATLSVHAHTQELGRLFFTPQERQALDDKRRLGANKAAAGVHSASALASEPEPAQEAASVIVPQPVVTGFVVRSSGKNTVWLNQRPAFGENLPLSGLDPSRPWATIQNKK
jgi:hypothetical protein